MNKPLKKIKVALATGGTGGHVFPAQALAEEIKRNGHTPILICDQRTKEFISGDLAKIESLKIFAPRAGNNWISTLIRLTKIFQSILHIRKYLKKKQIEKVIGFGGYASFPTLVAAISLGLDVFTHEQNAVLGKVNRLTQPFVRKIFLSFPTTKLLSKRYDAKAHVVGNLVRDSISKFASDAKPTTAKQSKTFTILVIGGSQGAKILSDTIPQAITTLPSSMTEHMVIYQQARKQGVDKTKKAYKGVNAKVIVKDFFEDIGKLMYEADLIIARSGASTVTEAALLGKPALFIPLKIATDNHQYYNAKFLEDAGGAIIIEEKDFSADAVAANITKLFNDRKLLSAMSKSAKKTAITGAAAKIFKEMLASN